MIRVGCAGWSLPRDLQPRFGAGESHLARYASRLDAAEINSSFYRPHRRALYEKWAAAVPAHFRFSAKLPKAITHERQAGRQLRQQAVQAVAQAADLLHEAGERRAASHQPAFVRDRFRQLGAEAEMGRHLSLIHI